VVQAKAADSYILVVDDTTAVTEFLEFLLADAGYAVVSCANGQEALVQIQRRRPVLVITDVAMPILNGWELVQALRSTEALATLPVILMSAATMLPFQPEELDSYTFFLYKPFHIADLLKLAKHALG
jgi:CheY-like chemotaxis protein